MFRKSHRQTRFIQVKTAMFLTLAPLFLHLQYLHIADLAGLDADILPLVLFGGVLFCGLLALAIIDLRTFRLPNLLTFSLIGLGGIQAYILNSDLPPALIGAGLGYTVFVVVEIGFRRLRGKDGLGRGDAKLLAAGGAWCGWTGLSFIVLIASLLGIIAACLPMFKNHEDGWIPFGPFLALAIFIVWTAQKLAGL